MTAVELASEFGPKKTFASGRRASPDEPLLQMCFNDSAVKLKATPSGES